MDTRDTTANLRVRDRMLDALTAASGALDAICFIAFGRVFTAFMTGNIVFLGLRVAGAASVPRPESLLASIAGFALGVYATTRSIGRPRSIGPWPPEVTRALAVSLIFHVGALSLWFVYNAHPTTYMAPILLAIWGIAMGMQSAAIRALHVDAVYTTAATATVIFLAGDIVAWGKTGAERRRLVSILLSLLVGATVGGLLLFHARILAPVLPVAITAAVVVTAAIVRRERPAVAGTEQAPGAPGLG